MKTLKFKFYPTKFYQSHRSKILHSYRLTVLKSYSLIVLLSFLLLHSTSLFAQREADNWIFAQWAGLNFNSGQPVPWLPVVNGPGFSNGTVMSDSIGNLLFYSNGDKVWNKNGEVMENGDNLLPGGAWDQSAISFPRPGFTDQYYLFTVSDWLSPKGLYYHIIDMAMNGGLGVVTEVKNVKLDAAFWAHDHQNVTKSRSGDSYWVVTRLYNDDRYASFLVDEPGVHIDPVYSSTGIFREFIYGDSGNIKISPDKKHLVNGHRANTLSNEEKYLQSFEVCTYNNETGEIGYLYMVNKKNNAGGYDAAYGCEFSPDSKYLFLTFEKSALQTEAGYLYQFDMQYISDSTAFVNSAIELSNQSGVNIQLSNDGKIYTSVPSNEIPNYQYYIGVIHKPWEKGLDCEFDPNGIYLLGRDCTWGLPNILLDYLYRFEWETDDFCQGTPVHFLPHFVPTPDSIEWNFDEFGPGSISHELAPTYAFQFPGTHEVEVDIWYPTGRFEHTSREIEIFPTPKPDLGPDIVICEGTTVTLYANCDADFYSWSTGQFGSPEITVSDSGTYWVRASFFDTGCTGSDTIHIGFYPPTLIDETNLEITPTSCDGASGSITGITALGPMPFVFQWFDLSGNPYGTNIDANGLPAGQYVLTITDANGCETISEVYTIEDAGNLQVLNVELIQPHCGRPDGQIVVHAFSPSGSTLEYSINDGADYSSDSIFTGLFAGTYVVRIRDVNGCEGFYLSNPINLADIPGPQITQVNITDETDFLGNGSIEIVASGSTPVIYYSIDGGTTWQENDGNFENLEFGIWNLVIRDENGCDTAFTVEIQNIILTYLHAVTGEGGYCDGNTAMVPVNVDNFNSVATFHLKLSYNAGNLQCEGFANVHPQLIDSLTGWVDQVAGNIHLAWNSPAPVTFTGSEKVADLVFTTKNPGQGELAWYTGETESYFTNVSGNPIPAEFQTGQVTIYEPPKIILLAESKTVCEGQFVSIMGIAQGNQNPLTYRWIHPTGDTTSNDPFFFSVTQADAGLYTLLVTDRVGCTDQKSIELIVSENPVAAFHGTDTLEMHDGDVLDAGEGMRSYRWSPGDTTQSIVIQEEGNYVVEMESLLGCIGTDSVYVKLVSEEIPDFEIYVPNAFSPNGDGVNDVFRVLAGDESRIYSLLYRIYDRWGGQVFDSQSIQNGWDGKKAGKDCPGGVYIYKIVFSVDGVVGNQERTGVVMLVR